MAEKDEKKTVTPLPQVGAQQEQQTQGQGPLAPTKEELTPGQKVMSAAPWNPNYKGEQTPATKPQGTVEAQQQAAPAESNKPYDYGTLYQNMVKRENYGLPTEAQLEEERKRNKRNALLATIGDGLAAFHKAYSHARGVKPMELENLSDKMYNRLEKVRKERQANELAYQNARLRAAGLDQQAQINFERQQRELDRLEETKRYHDALLGERGKDREAKQEISEAANQLKEKIAEKNREAQNQRNAASNAAKVTTANINHNGSGGKDDDYIITNNETITKTDEHGNKVTTQKSSSKQKVGGKGKARPKITF